MSNPLISSFLVEFLASFAIVFYSTNQMSDKDQVFVLNNALSLFFIVMPMAWFTHNTSGGHLNPWVSLAAFVSGKSRFIYSLINILGQVVGSFTGALTLKLIKTDAANSFRIEDGISKMEIGIIEGMIVFFLCLCFLITSYNRKISRAVYGFVVPSLYCVGSLLCGGKISARFNPAWYTPIYFIEDRYWNFWIVQVPVGAVMAVLAALIYKFVFDNNKTKGLERQLIDNDETKDLKF